MIMRFSLSFFTFTTTQIPSLFNSVISLLKVYFWKNQNSNPFTLIIRTKRVPVRTPGQMLENWSSRYLIGTAGHSRCFPLPTQMLENIVNSVVHRALYWKKHFSVSDCSAFYTHSPFAVILRSDMLKRKHLSLCRIKPTVPPWTKA